MNRKYKLIIAAVIILIVAIAEYFYYIKQEESKMGSVSFDSFKKQEIDGKIILENEEIGLSFELPDGWEIRQDQIANISMVSPDFKAFSDKLSAASTPQTGCWIGVSARMEKENSKYDIYYSTIKNLINNNLDNMSSDTHKYEIINISGYSGIKESLINVKDNPGESIVIEIPANNNVYFIHTDLFGQDKDTRCPERFNSFLSTISIKK